MTRTAMIVVVMLMVLGVAALAANCPNCGAPIQDDWKFCEKCGARLTTAARFAGQEIVGPDGGALVWVPPGRFRMGSTDADIDYVVKHFNLERERMQDEQPSAEVTMSGFWIGKTEVTNEQYARFLNEAKLTGVSKLLDVDDEYCGIELARGAYRAKPGREAHPMVDVSWYGAQAYCEHYSVALPTEAQWEYAARGPDSWRYPWGDTWDEDKCCNRYNNGSGTLTFSVGSFAKGASWCGALDMAGNVYEWCADWHDSDYYESSSARDPLGPGNGSYRVLRGGTFQCSAGDCRSAARFSGAPPAAYPDIGFRISRSRSR